MKYKVMAYRDNCIGTFPCRLCGDWFRFVLVVWQLVTDDAEQKRHNDVCPTCVEAIKAGTIEEPIRDFADWLREHGSSEAVAWQDALAESEFSVSEEEVAAYERLTEEVEESGVVLLT